MRKLKDRLRHAAMFEVIALSILTTVWALILRKPLEVASVLGMLSVTTATLWNLVFNWLFDQGARWSNVQRTLGVRVVHALLFQATLLTMLVPAFAWYLGVSPLEALLMNLSVSAFYVVYGFCFNIAYDRAFPVSTTSSVPC